MGYAKYREDDLKIIDSYRFAKHGLDLIPNTREPTQYFDCKYCDAIFTNRKELYSHIKSAHNIVRPLVVINGKVVSDRYVVSYIESAYIDLFGFSKDIAINGQSVNYLPDDDIIDFTSQLKQAFESDHVCSISFQTGNVEIELVAMSADDIGSIHKAIAQWENEVHEGKVLTTDFKNLEDNGTRLFLEGMYNYYIACKAKKDKAKRYDDAWSILSRFYYLPGVGRCVLKTIAYRRNWISSLSYLSDDGEDEFSIANDYYQRKQSDFKDTDSDKQLYIEDSVKKSLELVHLFQKGQYEDVKAGLAELPDFDLIDDKNFVDQLNLLCARLAVVDGNRNQAIMFYEKLNAPAFKEEYDLYKKGEIYFGE